MSEYMQQVKMVKDKKQPWDGVFKYGEGKTPESVEEESSEQIE